MYIQWLETGSDFLYPLSSYKTTEVNQRKERKCIHALGWQKVPLLLFYELYPALKVTRPWKDFGIDSLLCVYKQLWPIAEAGY